MDAATIAPKGIRELPGTLGDALDELEADDVIRDALGDPSTGTTSRRSAPSGTSAGHRLRTGRSSATSASSSPRFAVGRGDVTSRLASCVLSSRLARAGAAPLGEPAGIRL